MQNLKGGWGFHFPRCLILTDLFLNTFYKIEIKHEEKIKFKANTIENEISLTTFSVTLIISS